jgi:hypothetical protein
MADDNGSGSGGGNGSVYWEVNGKKHNGHPPVVVDAGGNKTDQRSPGTLATSFGGTRAGGHPGRGEVKINAKGVQGHSDTNFADIGKSNPPRADDHPGKFRVRLRFREQDLGMLDDAERTWIMARAKRIDTLAADSWFLEIHVPAIPRAQPRPGADWSDQPFEIRWEW